MFLPFDRVPDNADALPIYAPTTWMLTAQDRTETNNSSAQAIFSLREADKMIYTFRAGGASS
jgi:hypothetical protein